jgi:hypothetical protein
MADPIVENAEVKVPDKQSLSASVEAAAATHDTKEPEVKEPEKKESDKKAETKEEPKKDELSALEQEQATQLFRALKNPETAPRVIEIMAKEAGFEKITTKKEAAEVKDDVLDALKESLGTDFDFLADKLAPAIKKIVDSKLAENTRDIRDRLSQEDENKLANAADKKQTTIAREYFDAEVLPDNILDEMSKMMDKVNPSKDMSVEEYVENIFYAVAGKLHLTPTTKSSTEKANKNRSDAPSRLASSGTKQPVGVAVGSKKMGLDEAVRSAVESMEEK